MAFNIHPRVSAWLLVIFLAGCSAVPPLARHADNALTNSSPDREVRLQRAWSQAMQACVIEPPVEMTRAHPSCRALVTRGRELECLAKRLRQDGIVNRFTARDGLLNWEICVNEIARLLADGYYLGAREIERRLQLCEASLSEAADEGNRGFFLRLAGLGDEPSVVRPDPSEYGIAGRQAPVGLLRCEVLLPGSPAQVEPPAEKVLVPAVEQPKPVETILPEPPKPDTAEPAKKKRSKTSKKVAPAGKAKKKPLGVMDESSSPGAAPGGDAKTRGKQT